MIPATDEFDVPGQAGADRDQLEEVPISSMPQGADAVSDVDRIASIDVLRGFALLGILVMNIQSFAMTDAAYWIPTYGRMDGANYWVWFFSAVLADQKMMTIFSMLFGAGIILMADRQRARGKNPVGIHYRRMIVLLLFGSTHNFFFWNGDILFTYAVCGMIVYWLRKCSPAVLIVLGLLLVLVGAVVTEGLPHVLSEKARADLRKGFEPGPEKVAAEIEGMRGGWVAEFKTRLPSAIEMETFVQILLCWRTMGLMLIGMALYKLGIFTARASPATYVGLMAMGLFVGIPIVARGIEVNIQAGFDSLSLVFGEGGRYNYWGSLLVALGWVGLLMWLCQKPMVLARLHRLAAAGQMALTNYFMQTLLATTIFYGHGFGLYGKVDRVGQIGIVAAIWAFELVVSPLWLRQFRFGPAEWLWRSLTYWKRQPMRRTAV